MTTIDSAFLDAIHGYSYLGIFFWFLLYETIIPLPEEIVLLTAWYFASVWVVDPIVVTLVGIASFVCIDNFFYFLAARGSKYINKILRWVKPETLKKYQKRIDTNFPKTIFLLNLIPHIRVYGPILAWMSSIKRRRFFFYDTLAVTVFTVVFIWIGYYFSESLDLMKVNIIKYHTIIGYAILVMLWFLAILYINKKYKDR